MSYLANNYKLNFSLSLILDRRILNSRSLRIETSKSQLIPKATFTISHALEPSEGNELTKICSYKYLFLEISTGFRSSISQNQWPRVG